MAKGKRDTFGLKKVSTYDGHKCRVTEYIFSVTGDDTVERTNYLIERRYTEDVPEDRFSDGRLFERAHTCGEYAYTRRTETKQKFLCVGGPLAGKRVTDAPGYSAYNAATFNRGRNRQTEYRVVFVHDSSLKGKQ